MPLFEYAGERNGGDIISGTIEAMNKELAIKKLIHNNIKLLRIDELSYTQEIIHKRLQRLKRMKNYLENF